MKSDYSQEQLEALAYHNINVAKLTEYCNPFTGCWMELENPITQEEVLHCIEQQQSELAHTPIWTDIVFGKITVSPEEIRMNHIKKIAYFATNDITNPISIDVGIPALNCFNNYLVDDGNHRLAGAIIKGDKTIKTRVSGALSHAKDLGLYNPNEFELALMKQLSIKYSGKKKKIK